MELTLKEDRIQFRTSSGKIAQIHIYREDVDDLESGVNETIALLKRRGFRVENTTEYIDLEDPDKIML